MASRNSKLTLITDVVIVTMDDELGELNGNILVEGSVVRSVGPGVEAPDAERISGRGFIAIPGLVDCHRHVWQAPLRSVTADWSLADYVVGIRTSAAPLFRPEDMYAAQLAGALDAINCGVTTLVDYCHNVLSPEHGQAALRGLQDSGIRALWCAGFDTPPGYASNWGGTDAKAAFFKELGEGLREESLITLGIAPEDALIAAPKAMEQQYGFARSLGLRLTHHANSAGGTQEVARILAPQRLLGPDVLLVHMNHSTAEEWQQVAETGAKVVFTPGTELQMGIGLSSTEKCRSLGIAPTIGVDIVSNTNGDMFSAIRLALHVERGMANQARIVEDPLFSGTTIGAKEALQWATVNGAAACGMAERIGKISPGMAADIVLIDTSDVSMLGWGGQDAAEHVVMQAHPGVVDSVMIGGTFVKQNGRLPTDLEHVASLMAATTSHVVDQLGANGGFFSSDSKKKLQARFNA